MAEVEVEVHQDAKSLSKPNVDPQLSQQKRREFLLEWQKSRRDELVEKLRALEDSGASESEGEDVDFLEEVKLKGRTKISAEIPPVIMEEPENSVQVDSVSTISITRGRSTGYGRGRGNFNGHIETQPVFQPNVDTMDNTVRSYGRGNGRFKFLVESVADADFNWRDKKNVPNTDIPIEELKPEKQAQTKENPKNAGKNKTSDTKPAQKRFRRKRPAPYGLMLSEWLIDVPENFEEDWIGVLCPVGKRCIVVACRGRTRVYTRRNDYMGQFSSCLPGGSNAYENNLSGSGRRGLTILDCLWSDKAQTFYVLDLLCWNSYSVNNCSTDFRHFFLTSKLAESPDLTSSSERNPVPFQALPIFAATDLAHVMSTASPTFSDEIDGVLFYHKNVFYLPQVTPLVLWVHLSDIELLLSVGVSPELMGRERVRHEKARYYLEKPNYSKRNVATNGHTNGHDAEDNMDEPCDENGVPLG